jgi:hypothetical protein
MLFSYAQAERLKEKAIFEATRTIDLDVSRSWWGCG